MQGAGEGEGEGEGEASVAKRTRGVDLCTMTGLPRQQRHNRTATAHVQYGQKGERR